MSLRALLMSAVIGATAFAVSGCVSDPYYDGYGYGPSYGGGYYAGTAIIYDSGPRVHHRPRYVQPRPHRSHRVHRVQRPHYVHRHQQRVGHSERDFRRDYRARQMREIRGQEEWRVTR